MLALVKGKIVHPLRVLHRLFYLFTFRLLLSFHSFWVVFQMKMFRNSQYWYFWLSGNLDFFFKKVQPTQSYLLFIFHNFLKAFLPKKLNGLHAWRKQ